MELGKHTLLVILAFVGVLLVACGGTSSEVETLQVVERPTASGTSRATAPAVPGSSEEVASNQRSVDQELSSPPARPPDEGVEASAPNTPEGTSTGATVEPGARPSSVPSGEVQAQVSAPNPTGNGIGDKAYSFRLPSAGGPEYSLDSYSGEKNVVLVFYRAFW